MSWAGKGLLRRQHGAVSRAQLLERGFSRAAIRTNVSAGRWQNPIPGIYVTFTGELSSLTLCWIAVLHAGPGAVLSHTTAGILWRLLPGQPLLPIHLTVPRTRGARSRRGLVVHRVLLAPAAVGSPPRTSVSATALALCAQAQRSSELTTLLGRIAQQYPDALDETIAMAIGRPNLPRRADFLAIARDAAGGTHSELEHRYLVDVERAHGLPGSTRQRAVGGSYQDVYYDEYKTTVELDGRAVHGTASAAGRDRRRDNLTVVRGEATLRYDWKDVRHRPCAVAAEVAAVLRTKGWASRPHPCAPGCHVRSATA